jgi:DNA-binding transcriptional ArsR family regulator
VKELARHLGGKAVSLYYHVDALENAGLIKAAKKRRKGRPMERLYEAVAREVVIDPSQRSPNFLAALRDAYQAVLRASARHLDKALHAERGRNGPRRNTMVLETRARLGPRDLDELRARIDALHRFAAARRSRGAEETFYLVTACSRMVDDRRRRSREGRRARPPHPWRVPAAETSPADA